jgi:glycosyltransferase involved in cell wall biosynthesis
MSLASHILPKISIIVPVYNVEKFLNRTLESLINQSLKDIEIIVVNDGSTDNTYLIVQKYAGQEERIRIINKPNGGLSSARNSGIEIALGEFIMFCDGDDYLPSNICESLYRTAKKENYDVVCCDITTVNEKGRELNKFKVSREGVFEGGKTAVMDFLSGRMYRPSAYNKLVRKELFEKYDLTFPLGLYFEDNFFVVKLLTVARTIRTVSVNGYFYVRRRGSITTTIDKKHIDDTASICALIQKWIKDQGLGAEVEALYSKFCTKKWSYTLKIAINGQPDKAIYAYFLNSIPKEQWQNMHIRYKLLCRLGLMMPGLPNLFMKRP